jgi:hypothetical protein
MLNWLNPQMWSGYGNYGDPFGPVPGQFGVPADIAPAGVSAMAAPLEQAPAGAAMLYGAQVPRGSDQAVNPKAVMARPQRQQLAQIMAYPPPQPQPGFGRGPNYGSQGGSHYGGYSTSGPQSGGYGYGGGTGGWGWGGGARSSATQGGMWGGLR